MEDQNKHTVLQDSDGDWYWIPNEEVNAFNSTVEKLSGLQYLDNPEVFDTFSVTWGEYATGGCPTNVPPAFKKSE